MSDVTDPVLELMNHAEHCTGPQYVTFVGHRGDEMVFCHGCSRTVPMARLRDQAHSATDAPSRGRYRLDCVRCDRGIYLDSPKPRIPLCAPCARQGRKNQL